MNSRREISIVILYRGSPTFVCSDIQCGVLKLRPQSSRTRDTAVCAARNEMLIRDHKAVVWTLYVDFAFR
jgi:hypothetical protein